jgi:hypothetical protein
MNPIKRYNAYIMKVNMADKREQEREYRSGAAVRERLAKLGLQM